MVCIIMGSINHFGKSQHLHFTNLPYSSVRDIMVKDKKLYPYKPTISQKLNERQIENHVAFCQRVKGMIDNFELDVNKISFSDESHIYLIGVPNRQNTQFGPGPS